MAFLSLLQIRDPSVWHSISYQTMRQLKQLNTTDISAVARSMAVMGYRDTFLINGLADAMWCLAKVNSTPHQMAPTPCPHQIRRGKLFDSAAILDSFRKLNFIPRMPALDAITADLRRQGWDRYKWRSTDIARIFLYALLLSPSLSPPSSVTILLYHHILLINYVTRASSRTWRPISRLDSVVCPPGTSPLYLALLLLSESIG